MMQKRNLSTIFGAVAAVTTFACTGVARAEDAPKQGWSNKADLAYVATAGNSNTSMFGLAYKGAGNWGKNGFEANVGGVKSESTINEITNARGQADDYELEGSATTYTTTELYYVNGRYNRKITDKFFWYAGLGWDRNTPAGIDSRFMALGGVGNIWVDSERIKFRTDYAVTFTDQSDVVDNPDISDTYGGLRVSWAYLHKFGKAVTYGNDLVLDENLSETSDWRGDMLNTLAVEMSSHLALKVGLRWLYDADPSFFSVPLLNTFDANIGEVLVENKSLDTIFTTALVVNW